MTFDPSGRLLVLVPDSEAPLLVFMVETNDDGILQVRFPFSTGFSILIFIGLLLTKTWVSVYSLYEPEQEMWNFIVHW